MRTIAENIVDALIVTLGLDTSEYQQGMDEAERSTREFSEKAPREAERGLNQIEQKFGGAFRGIFHSFIAPLTAALGTMGIFSSYTQTADRIGKTAARIGASAEDLQAFGEAAKRAGGSVEGFMGAFESLNGQLQRMQAMGGKGRLTPILKQLGISATENGQVKDTFQILRELAGAAERIGNRNFAGLARNLGLDNGTIMLLQQGRIALDEVIKRQKELGVYTKQDFEITAKFNDAISDLTQSFKQLAAPILRVITPALTTVADWLTKIAQTFREHQGFIVAGLTVIAGVMSGTLLKAAVALGAALKPLLVPIAAIAALGAIFDEIAVYAEGGETAFEGLWQAIGTPEQFRAVGNAISETFTGALQTVKDFAKEAGSAFVDLAQKWGESFDANVFVEAISSAWDGIKKALEPLTEAFTPIKNAAQSLLDMFGELGKLAIDLAKSIAEVFAPEQGKEWSLLRGVVEVISNAVSGIAETLRGVFDWVGKIAKGLREALNAGVFASLKDAIAPVKEAFSAVFSVVENIVGGLKDAVAWVLKLFTPGGHGSAWDGLKNVIDGISITIQAIAEVVRRLFTWLDQKITAIRQWLGMDDPVKREAAETQVLGGKSKEEVIQTKAEEIKNTHPGLSDDEAREIASSNLESEINQRYNANEADDLFKQVAEIEGFNANVAPVEKPSQAKQAQASAVQPSAPVQKESSPGWWASLFGGNGKAADTAAATVGSKAADKTEISQDMRKTISVKYDTNVTNNNTFNGVERSAEVRDAVAQGSRSGVERGLSFHTPAVDLSQQ